MKKTLLLLLVLVMTGCSVNNPEKEKSNSNNKVEYTNIQKQVDNKNIFMFIESDASYAIDVFDPERLSSDESTVAIISATIGDIDYATVDEQGNVVTPLDIVDFEVLEGNIDGDLLRVFVEGGLVDIETLIPTLLPQEVEKMGLNVIPEDQRNEHYVQESTDASFDYIPGEQYVLIISKRGNEYYINTDGFGTFTINETAQSRGIFDEISVSNVLTENELIIDLD